MELPQAHRIGDGWYYSRFVHWCIATALGGLVALTAFAGLDGHRVQNYDVW